MGILLCKNLPARCDEPGHDRINLRCIYYSCGFPYTYCYTCDCPKTFKCEKCKVQLDAKFQADRAKCEEEQRQKRALNPPPEPWVNRCNRCYQAMGWNDHCYQSATCRNCESTVGIIRCAYFPCGKVLTIDYEKEAGYHVLCDPNTKCLCGGEAVRGSVACYDCLNHYNCRTCGKRVKRGEHGVCQVDTVYLRNKECLICSHEHGNQACPEKVKKTVTGVHVVPYNIVIPGIYYNSTGSEEQPFRITEEVECGCTSEYYSERVTYHS